MDIETLIINEVDEQILLGGCFPGEISIKTSDMIVLEKYGEKVINPTYSDMVDNDYGLIITRVFFKDDDYIKFEADLFWTDTNQTTYKIRELGMNQNLAKRRKLWAL